jgi:hypothetical protein
MSSGRLHQTRDPIGMLAHDVSYYDMNQAHHCSNDGDGIGKHVLVKYCVSTSLSGSILYSSLTSIGRK